MGLGRYRFGEVLSTSFFGPRYKVAVDPTNRLSEPPIRFSDPPARISELPVSHETEAVHASSLRPRADLPLALRLVEADAPSLIELLARSVQAVRDLDHRAILRPLQIVRSSTRLGVVTPHTEGMTLAQLLEDVSMRQVSIPPAVVLRIASDVLEGLEAMRVHATGSRRQDWVFGGLTPDSIHIGADGQTRLLDPGLAGSAARQPCWSHEAAALAYTAPEQTGADATFDASSDIFSLGVILWELLTGRPLFGAATAAQTLESLHRSPIPRVQRHHFVRGEPIAFSLAQAVAQALRRKPAQRFNNYDAFASALTQSGEVAPPAEVAELVSQALSHESVDELRARLARDGEASSSSSQRIARVAADVVAMSPPRAASVSPITSATASMDLLRGVAQRRLSATPMQTPAPLPAPLPTPDELPAGVRTLRRPASLLPSQLAHKLSAFPVGDLLRRSGQRHGRAVWPLAIAAVAVLGFGAYRLLPTGDQGQRSAAAPVAPPVHPVTPAPPPAVTNYANAARDEAVNPAPAEEAPSNASPAPAPVEPPPVLSETATANVRPVPPVAASLPPPRRPAAVSSNASSKRKRAAQSPTEKPQRESAPAKPPPRTAAPASGAQPKFIPDDI